ncbi:hypothetical protein [Methylobacillus flagellatus]|uniref:Uncharacterized protein n=1 Tax=Methylobacillus flagellatus (strain ATCC 51484 / DSM 6875 / VKM B-1610 / KT) TaxID=265072 RepID=Q1H3K1_METFK|nr:hypothetical protein [Methylobacillus flagellatus]ABE48936.1 hypothetical protein Mfla_0666 [Methylobacillus flagellatus KT]
MTQENPVPLFPIVTFTTTPVPENKLILFSPVYLNALGQHPENAATGPHYAFTIDQAMALMLELHRAIDQIENSSYLKRSLQDL